MPYLWCNSFCACCTRFCTQALISFRLLWGMCFWCTSCVMVLMELQYTPYPHFLKELVRVVLKHLGHREVGCSQSPPIREDWFWCSTVPQRPTKKTILRGPLCPKKTVRISQSSYTTADFFNNIQDSTVTLGQKLGRGNACPFYYHGCS